MFDIILLNIFYIITFEFCIHSIHSCYKIVRIHILRDYKFSIIFKSRKQVRCLKLSYFSKFVVLILQYESHHHCWKIWFSPVTRIARLPYCSSNNSNIFLYSTRGSIKNLFPSFSDIQYQPAHVTLSFDDDSKPLLLFS